MYNIYIDKYIMELNYDSDNSKSSNNSNNTLNSNGKRQRKQRSDIGKPRKLTDEKREYNLTKTNRKIRNDKGKKRVEHKEKQDKLLIYLYGKTYGFKKITDVEKFFSKNENINNIDMTDNIKYVLLNTYLLRRLCNVIKGLDEQSLKKPETRQKYLNDINLRIIPLF